MEGRPYCILFSATPKAGWEHPTNGPFSESSSSQGRGHGKDRVMGFQCPPRVTGLDLGWVLDLLDFRLRVVSRTTSLDTVSPSRGFFFKVSTKRQ